MLTKKQLFYNSVFIQLYDEVYSKMKQNSIDIFLCGGASYKNFISVRDKLRKNFDMEKNLRILYPEDLFIEMLNRDKAHDLLSLEKFLADNCDFICIVCESAGSLVELGAFTNNEETVDKVFALIEEKRKRQKSFIMLGPVKVLKSKGKERVIFYNDNIQDLTKVLVKNFKLTINKKRKTSSNYKPLNTLIGLYHFLMIVLYFFKEVEMDMLINALKDVYEKKGYTVRDFDTLFRPTLKLLYKDSCLRRFAIEEKIMYSLTEKGYYYTNQFLGDLSIKRKNVLFDGIRFDIMNNEYYRFS